MGLFKCLRESFKSHLTIFFFKQKTAYEIVSRDWSSDVCSSDLRFLKCQSLVAAAPRHLYCPFLVAAASPLLLLTDSRGGSSPDFYTAHFSMRQRPRFLKCPSPVAAAPRNLYCPFLVAAASPASFIDRFSLRQRPRLLYCPFLVAAAPRFLYCPFLLAAAPPLLLLTGSRSEERRVGKEGRSRWSPYH